MHPVKTMRGVAVEQPACIDTVLCRASVFFDAFPAVFLAIAFVCLSFPSQNKNFNFPAA